MPYPTDEPEDPGPHASFEARERYRRAHERWATEDGPGTALARLEKNHRRLMDMHSPVRAALWLALMRNTDELFEREQEALNGEAGIPAVLSMAEAIVRKAIAGDVGAFNSISDRIEGRVGLRKGDVDPELDNKQTELASVIEGVVAGLTKAKLDGTIPDPPVIDVEPISDDEAASRRSQANGRDARVEREEGSHDDRHQRDGGSNGRDRGEPGAPHPRR